MELRYRILSIEKDGLSTYGGSQMLFKGKSMHRCGCGVIGALDVLEYLHRCHIPSAFFAGGAGPLLPWEQYEAYANVLHRRFLPLFYPVGMNGLELAGGMNRYFRKYALPYRARWSAPGRKLWDGIEEMLSNDIPVILSIGVDFPDLWHQHKLAFYRKEADGSFRRVTAACSHYVTVTGLDGTHLHISSWGKEYYLSRAELDEHIRHESCRLLSNIVYITKRGE